MATSRAQLRLPQKNVCVVASISDPTPLRWWQKLNPKGGYRVTDFRLLEPEKDLSNLQSVYHTTERQPQDIVIFNQSVIEEDALRQSRRILSSIRGHSLKSLQSLELLLVDDDGQKSWFVGLCSALQAEEGSNLRRFKIQGRFLCGKKEGAGKAKGAKRCQIFGFKNLTEINIDWTCDCDDGVHPHRCRTTGFNNLLANCPDVEKIRLCFRRKGSQPILTLKNLDLRKTQMKKLLELTVEGDGVEMNQELQQQVLDTQPLTSKIVFDEWVARGQASSPPVSNASSGSTEESSVAISSYDADSEREACPSNLSLGVESFNTSNEFTEDGKEVDSVNQSASVDTSISSVSAEASVSKSGAGSDATSSNASPPASSDVSQLEASDDQSSYEVPGADDVLAHLIEPNAVPLDLLPRPFNADSESEEGDLSNDMFTGRPVGLPFSVGRFQTLYPISNERENRHQTGTCPIVNKADDEEVNTSPSSATSDPLPETPTMQSLLSGDLLGDEEEDGFMSQVEVELKP